MMSYSATIRRQIAATDRQLANITEQQRSEQQKLDQLLRLRSTVIRRQQQFNTIQDRRQHTINRLNQVNLQAKSARGYSSKMQALLSGNRYRQASQSFQDSLHRVNIEIQEAERQIQHLGRVLSDLNNDKAQYQQRLNRAVSDERREAQRERERQRSRRNGA